MKSDVFQDYAAYYNLLYRDKDYASEVDYVEALVARVKPGTKAYRILDVGCGTGRHASALVQRGHTVVGVDASEQMIELARLGVDQAASFVVADARRFRLQELFDVVISLFHVASYQTENADLLGYFRSVSNHLEPTGLFVFDCWYGPAVLHQKPGVRIKELEDDDRRIVRIARPGLEPEENCVTVVYDLLIERKDDRKLRRISESHRMRYLFLPEIREFLGRAGLQFVHCEEWITGKPLGLDTWSACFVAGKS